MRLISTITKYAIASTICCATLSAAAADDVVSKAYGLRVYYDDQTSTGAELVSFNVDDPQMIEVEAEIGKAVRAAAYANGIYYMIESDDNMVAYRLSSFDVATKKYSVIREYALADQENALIFQCMTYNEAEDTFYAYAFDIRNSVSEGETLDIPFCLYTLDVTTGNVTLIGENNRTQIFTLAADSNGILYGIDALGYLYSINKETGSVLVEEGACFIQPNNLQSMAFDQKNNLLYWAGFKIENSTGVGFFGHFTYSEDEWWWSYNSAAQEVFDDNSEIIGLYIDSNPLVPGTPGAVTDLTLTPGENGALEATLSWVNPTHNNGGSSLKDPIEVNIYRDGTLLANVKDQQPGENGSVTITEETSGILNYTVTTQNTEGQGRSVFIDGFVGRDVPASVGNITIQKPEGTENLTVAWTAPTAGAHNGWFDTSSITYNITRLPDEAQLATAISELSFTDTTIENVCGYSYIITPVNADGEGLAAESPVEFAGAPLNIPFACDFTTDALVRLWKVIDADNDGQSWYPAKNRVESFMKYFPDNELSPELESNDWLISAPINFSADKTYVMKYWVRSQGPLFPVNFNVTIGNGASVEAQTNILKSVNGFDNQSMEEQTAIINVESDGTYNVAFQALNRVSLHVKDVTIEECDAIDLVAAAISGSSSPIIGTPAEYTVEVQNKGFQPQKDFTVELIDADQNVIASTTVTEAIQPFTSANVVIEWSPEATGSYLIKARVNVEGDVNPSDNITTTSIAAVVLEKGEWIDVATETMGLDGVVPFNVTKKYSLSQTIYNASDMNNSSAKIKGMKLYYNATQDATFPVKISLANTDKTDFNDKAAPVAENEFTTMYEGNLTFPAAQASIIVLFDNPFEYDGTNLCLMSSHNNGELIDNIYFYSMIDMDDTNKYTWYHFNTEPFDFPETVSRYIKNRPSISFFIEESEDTGIIGVEFDSQNSDDANTRYYNLQGIRVDNPTNGIFIRVNGNDVKKVIVK